MDEEKEREIKFKMWNIKLKEMFEYNILWGNYGQGDGYIGVIPFGESLTKYRYKDNMILIDPHNCKIMQYTGLKDKNGKEIYFDFHIISDGISKTVVHWNSWNLLDDVENGFDDWEIIGNIYDNPELIQ